MINRRLHLVAKIVFCVIGLLIAAWAAGALWYDLPATASWRKSAALCFSLTIAGFWLSKHQSLRIVACALPFAAAAWWFSLKPSNDREWLPDVARTASAEIHGDEITIHHIRNFDYRTETDSTPKWETRTVRLSDITGIDLAINYWGSPYMAHPIVSFQFANAPPLCFSIETRKERGESYSAVGGLYRQFELIYIVAEERDVIRLRTNYRNGEDVYLYRLNITPENARVRFLDYVAALNELTGTPRWYNAITTNCTTAIRTQHAADQRTPWDWRILVNGKGDEMLYENGRILAGGLSFAELKKRSLINDAARAADSAPDFSDRIRTKLPATHVSRALPDIPFPVESRAQARILE